MLETIEIETAPQPTAAIIWLHGLGADGHDFEPIVPEIVGHAPIVPESAIMEVPLQVDPDAGFLPPEWK